MGITGQHLLKAASVGTRGKRHFTGAGRSIAALIEHFCQSLLSIRQNVCVSGDAMYVRVAAGMQTHAGGHALRRVHKRIAETHTLAGKPVGVRGLDDRVAVARQTIGAVLIVGDDQQIPFSVGRRARYLRCRKRRCRGADEFASGSH